MSDKNTTHYPANLYVDWALNILNRPCIVSPVRSGAHSSVYKLASKNESWFVKIANNLSEEIAKLKWLHTVKLTTPELVAQNIQGTTHAILITGLPGIDLAELSAKQPKYTTVKQVAYALKRFHAIDAVKCPFKAYLKGHALVHGDACLPNIIYEGTQLSGYIDFTDMGVGSIDVDLSAAIWSLQFNIGAGYGQMFLEEYGHSVTTEKEVDRLYNLYVNSPIFRR